MLPPHSTLLRSALGNLTIKIGSAALGLLNGIFLARLLGPGDFGVYSLILGAVNLLATLAAFGFPQVIARNMAAYHAQNDWSPAKGLLLISHGWVIALSVALMVAGHGLSSTTLHSADLPDEVKWAALLLIPWLSLSQLRAAVIRGLHRVMLADFPDQIVRPGIMLAALYAWQTFEQPVDVAWAIQLHLGAAVLAAIIGLALLAASIPRTVWSTKLETETARWGKNASTFLLIGLIGMLEGQMPIYLLGYLSTTENVGLFQAANQWVNGVSVGLAAANLPLQPKLAAAWAKADLTEFRRLTKEGARISAIAAIGASLLLVPFSTEFLSLSGHRYETADSALRILIAGQFFNAIMGPCGLVLAATHFQGVILLSRILSLLVTTGGCFFLIKESPLEGAAIAVSCGLLSWNLLLAWTAARKLRVFTPALGYGAFSRKPA